MLESGVPDEGPSLEPESWDPVAEALDGARGRGADGLAELLEGAPRDGRQGCEVGPHLCGGESFAGS